MLAALDLTKDKFGKLNNIINCAGIGVAFKTYNFNKKLPHKLEDFSRVIQVCMMVCLEWYSKAVCDRLML